MNEHFRMRRLYLDSSAARSLRAAPRPPGRSLRDQDTRGKLRPLCLLVGLPPAKESGPGTGLAPARREGLKPTDKIPRTECPLHCEIAAEECIRRQDARKGGIGRRVAVYTPCGSGTCVKGKEVRESLGEGFVPMPRKPRSFSAMQKARAKWYRENSLLAEKGANPWPFPKPDKERE